MRRLASRTFDVVLVLAVLAVPVLGVVEAIEGHPWFLTLMGVSLVMQGWRARCGGRYIPASVLRRLPGRHRTTSSVEGEPE